MKHQNERFTIRVESSFRAFHHLRQYKGRSEAKHEHLWKIEAIFQASRLDADGIGIDYIDAQKALRRLSAPLDRQDINDVPPFDKINPTSEHLARWFFSELNKQIKVRGAKLIEIIVWEGPKSYVSYIQAGP